METTLSTRFPSAQPNPARVGRARQSYTQMDDDTALTPVIPSPVRALRLRRAMSANAAAAGVPCC